MIKEIANGRSYFFQETIEDKPIDTREDLFRTITLTPQNENNNMTRKCYISSVLINEPEFRNYKLKEKPKNLTVTYRGEETWPEYEGIVRFSPLKFQETWSTDSVEYSLELVGENPEIPCESRLIARISVSISHKEELEMCFRGPPGIEYYVRVKASVRYQSQRMRVFTYPIGYVDFNDTSFKEKEYHSLIGKREVGIGAVGIVSLTLVVATVILGVKGFRKLVRWNKKPIVAAREQEEAFDDEGDRSRLNEEERSAVVVAVERSE